MAMPEGNYTSFSRKIYRDGQVSEIPGTESLSSARVKGEEAINVLCKVQCYEPTCDMVVEAMGELNQLNIYSPAGERAKTVCVGKKLDDPAEVEALPMSDRVMTYSSGCTFKEGFGVAYLGKSDRKPEKQQTGLPTSSSLTGTANWCSGLSSRISYMKWILISEIAVCMSLTVKTTVYAPTTPLL